MSFTQKPIFHIYKNNDGGDDKRNKEDKRGDELGESLQFSHIVTNTTMHISPTIQKGTTGEIVPQNPQITTKVIKLFHQSKPKTNDKYYKKLLFKICGSRHIRNLNPTVLKQYYESTDLSFDDCLHLLKKSLNYRSKQFNPHQEPEHYIAHSQQYTNENEIIDRYITKITHHIATYANTIPGVERKEQYKAI